VDLRGSPVKGGDGRFLARVFTAAERDRIAAATHPEIVLWSLWAVKEGAYKAAVKMDPAVPFLPRRYEARPEGEGEGALKGRPALPPSPAEVRTTTGEVATPLGPMSFLTAENGLCVHAVVAPKGSRVMGAVFTGVTEPSGEDPSRLLRRLVRGVCASVLGVSSGGVAVLRRRRGRGLGPPEVLLDGRPCPIDLSLSHDGPYGAFALLILPGVPGVSEPSELGHGSACGEHLNPFSPLFLT